MLNQHLTMNNTHQLFSIHKCCIYNSRIFFFALISTNSSTHFYKPFFWPAGLNHACVVLIPGQPHRQTYVYLPIEFVLFFQTNIHISQDYKKLLIVRTIHIELWLTWISLEFSLMNLMGIILSNAINTNSYMHHMQLTWRSRHV